MSATEILGWAFAPESGAPVLVQAVLNHEILGEAVANIHRADLAAAGLGDGNSGYAIRLFRPIDPLWIPFVDVKVNGGDAELPRAPMLGFAEYFAALYRAHPAAGRQRSVFGGVWTDRTDASALLRGKTAIGAIPTGTEPALAALLHSGLCVVALRDAPPAVGAPTDQVNTALEDAALLPLLRAVLEDQPLVLAVTGAADGAGFAQPSAANPSPSPAECVMVVVALTDGVALDVVRDSHRLPEFTPHGVSRWASGVAADGVAVAGARGLLDRHALPVGSAAVVGAGTLYRLAGEGATLAALVVPGRGLPLAVAGDPRRRELVRPSGVRVWV